MALFLSFVPCVAIYVFIGFFMDGFHKMEQDKLARESAEDRAQGGGVAGGAQDYLTLVEVSVELSESMA
jgi:hypothetical protein